MPVLDGMGFLKQALDPRSRRGGARIDRVGDVRTAVELLNVGAYDFIQKPVDPEQLLLTASRALERRQFLVERRQHQRAAGAAGGGSDERARRHRAPSRGVVPVTLEALGSAIDTRDVGTHAHSRRVRGYSLAIARAHGVPESEMPDIEHGVLLHDIGKIGIPDAILLKPGALTPEEWMVMRTHPEIGRRLVEKIPFLRGAVPIVYHHHERWDGTGYRSGLRGAEIPLGAADLRARGRARCHDLRPPVLARDLVRDGAGRDQALCGHALRSRGRRHLRDHPDRDVRGHPDPQPARSTTRRRRRGRDGAGRPRQRPARLWTQAAHS